MRDSADVARRIPHVSGPLTSRRRRLAEELAEAGLRIDATTDWGELLLTEVDYALRPIVHERRIPSVGAIITPTTPAEQWETGRS